MLAQPGEYQVLNDKVKTGRRESAGSSNQSSGDFDPEHYISSTSTAGLNSTSTYTSLAKPSLPPSAIPVTIFVRIYEARHLHAATPKPRAMQRHEYRPDSPLHPVCCVQFLEDRRYTKIGRGSDCLWDSMFPMEAKLGDDEIERGKIRISVMNAASDSREELVGSFEVGIGYIQSLDGQTISSQWVALATPPHCSYPSILCQGFVRLSIRIVDRNYTMNDSMWLEHQRTALEHPVQTHLNTLLLPPSLRPRNFDLCVKCFRGEDFVKADGSGPADAYVAVTLGNDDKPMRTQILGGKMNPCWNEELRLPFMLPTLKTKITIQVVDRSTVEETQRKGERSQQYRRKSVSDDVIGEATFSLFEVHKDGFGPKWVNLTSDKEYSGRLLLGMNAHMSDMPGGRQGSKLHISACREPTLELYTIRADIYEVLGTPVHALADLGCDKIQLAVEVSIGSCRLVSQHSRSVQMHGTTTKALSALWRESLTGQGIAFPQDGDSVPDIVITVLAVPEGAPKDSPTRRHLGDEKSRSSAAVRIARCRMKISDVLACGRKPLSWVPMSDMGQSGVDSTIPGSGGHLLCGVVVGKTGTHAVERSTNLLPLTIDLKDYELRFQLFRAKGVAWDTKVESGMLLGDGAESGLDEGSHTEVFVEFSIGAWRVESKRVQATQNPMWFQSVVLKVKLPANLSEGPEVGVALYRVVNRRERPLLLGRCSLSSSDTESPSGWSSMPTWYKLVADKEGCGQTESRGEILITMGKLSDQEYSNSPLNDPKLVLEEPLPVEVALMGLSNLAFGSMSVRTCHLEISFEESPNRTCTVKTNVCDVIGTEAHLVDVVTVTVRVPANLMFCLPLVVKLFGEVQNDRERLLGTTSISIVEAIQAARERAIEKRVCHSGEVPRRLTRQWSEPTPPRPEPATLGQADGRSDADVKTPLLHNDGPGKQLSYLGLEQGKYPVAETILRGGEDVDCGKDAHGFEQDRRPIMECELEKDITDWPLQDFPIGSSTCNIEKSILRSTSTKQIGSLQAHIHVRSADSLATEDVSRFYTPRHLMLRVYVLRAMHLRPRKGKKHVDSYLSMSVGRGSKADESPAGADGGFYINDVAWVQKNPGNSDFFKCYELPAELPDNAHLKISLWDYDPLTHDELIGSTSIDIRNRFLSTSWNNMQVKPVERRDLWNPTSIRVQGHLEMWLEILTLPEATMIPKVSIQPSKPSPYQLRLVVWNVEGLELPQTEKKTADVFICGELEGQNQPSQRHETDVHYGVSNGCASFNWRMVFTVNLPCKNPLLKLKVWDKQWNTSAGGRDSEYIAETVLNLGGLFKKAYRRNSSEELTKQWVTLSSTNASGPRGKVSLSLELIPEHVAFTKPVLSANDGLPKPNRQFSIVGQLRKIRTNQGPRPSESTTHRTTPQISESSQHTHKPPIVEVSGSKTKVIVGLGSVAGVALIVGVVLALTL